MLGLVGVVNYVVTVSELVLGELVKWIGVT